MGCIDGIDPADFESGVIDPGDVVSPVGSELSIEAGETDFTAVGYVQFEVNVSPVNYINDVSFSFSTSNGTALAGTNYTARTAVAVTIPAGTGLYQGQITVLKPTGVHGDKTLTVTISGAVNATIADAAAVLTIHYDGPPPPPPDHSKFTSWPSAHDSVYDQFGDGNPSACTAYAVTALTSCHEYLDTGRDVRFDPDDLWDGDGHITDGATALAYAKNTGVKVSGGTRRRKLHKWGQINGADHDDLIRKIKRKIREYGAVDVVAIWYTRNHAGNNTSFDWNTTGIDNNPNHILAIPQDHGDPVSCLGHSFILIGWSDNIHGTGKGGFLVQNSFGKDWGGGGRGWLPYRTITTRQYRNNTGHGTCNASTGGPYPGYYISDPWFRFYWAQLKHGG